MTRIELIIGVVMLAFVDTIAQSTPSTDSLPSDQVEVLKRFDAVLQSSEKGFHSPGYIKLDSVTRSYEYNVKLFDVAVPSVNPELNFDELRQNSFYQPFDQIIKLGLGYPTNPYALVSYGQASENRGYWNASLEHHSMYFDDRYQDISRTRLILDGGRLISENWSVKAGIRFGHRLNQYFPLYGDTTYRESDASRTWFRAVPSLGLEGYWGQWKISGDAKLVYVKDSEDLQQNRFFSSASACHTWKDRHNFVAKLAAEFNTLHLKDVERDLNNFRSGFAYTYGGEIFSFRAGGQLITGDGTDLYPDLGLTWNLIDQKMSWSFSASGNKLPLDLTQLLTYNPYIHSDQDSIPFQRSWRIQSTLSGRLASLIYSLQAAYVNFQDQYFFLNHTPSPHLFDLVFDDGHYVALSGNIEMDVTDRTHLRIEAEKKFYSLELLAQAWNRPTYNLGILINHFMLQEKLMLGSKIMLLGDAAYLEDMTSNVIDPIVQFNLESKYLLSERWSIFLEAKNILNNKSTTLYLYDAIGINFLAGILYKY